MTLHTATVDQLLEWQAAIVHELARRAQPPAPVVAAPPWLQPPATHAPVVYAPPPQPYYPPQPAPQPRPPAMLAGQQRLPPGTVIATDRTDPKAAAIFAQTAPRMEGVPALQGNGRGEGSIGFQGEE